MKIRVEVEAVPGNYESKYILWKVWYMIQEIQKVIGTDLPADSNIKCRIKKKLMNRRDDRVVSNYDIN